MKKTGAITGMVALTFAAGAALIIVNAAFAANAMTSAAMAETIVIEQDNQTAATGETSGIEQENPVAVREEPGIEQENPALNPLSEDENPNNSLLPPISLIKTKEDGSIVIQNGLYGRNGTHVIDSIIVPDGITVTQVKFYDIDSLIESAGVDFTTVTKTFPDGIIITLQYYVDDGDGNETMAAVTYGDDTNSFTGWYHGKAADMIIERFNNDDRWVGVPLRYEQGQPDENDIDEAAAIDIAVKAITEKYALKQETLDRFTITAVYFSAYEHFPGPMWWVSMYPTNVEEYSEIGCYTAVLDAKTGEVRQRLSADDGKG